VVILTDDQSFDTLPSNPPAMPWLQSQIRDPKGHWLWFPNAFIETPLCCPSRATILTGRYSHHTHVRTNDDGHRFDESSTLATWLHGAGYFTGLFGKYLNRYPFGRLPYIPPGWDRWAAKQSTAAASTYYDYGFVDQGVPMQTSDATPTYATDLFGERAVDFVRTAPADRPFFLYYAPSAPHPPWTPPRRHLGAFEGVPLPVPRSVGERNVSDKPGWVQALPPLDALARAQLQHDRRRERATLLGADDTVRRIVESIEARGELDNTVIFFLTDNGYSFGEHRIRGKRCPYEECIRTPFAVRVPGRASRVSDRLISNVDLAPTIAELAGVAPGFAVDGHSFAANLEGSGRGPPGPAAVLIEWAGDKYIPRWWGVRTHDFAYIEDSDGTVELYDLTGVRGRADPLELRNRSDDPRYRAEVRRLSRTLDRLRSQPPTRR
jgi:arylsulfatase A-like enzyme